MATVHFIQQGKGGVGKSMIASMLYQVLGHLGKSVIAFDTDPENATLASYKEFSVSRLNIMKGDNIDKRAFDSLFDEIFAMPEEAHVVIDNGASSFIALGSYIKENTALTVLQENGHAVYLHTVVTGGQAITETVSGLKKLAINFPETPLIVWLNPYFGEISMDGKPFEEFKVYKDHSSQFSALIKIPEADENTLGRDLAELFAKRMSFEAGINSSKGIMVRARLKRYWDKVVDLIRQAEFAA